ncbi:branched-chain amino acid ABC transporter permease [Zavarzinia compransoris]|uniref:Branched-chain amino acid ABC transporter permease n=1 Tax=Zavarzinia compransoris TaxID=1264899 RepID=A0A317E1Z8_9PROT|nr:branched-chain amino acid ABC transporter permease [Zavarzinia compransoris]PWR20999.1 branched-chain amino acid ABC transporter permease [Zavarzinia compransoris]TDP44031.1 amino acid/amide ABC transporter membrane protein 2 (HAAT family) [Zavarzinia compransoris]
MSERTDIMPAQALRLPRAWGFPAGLAAVALAGALLPAVAGSPLLATLLTQGTIVAILATAVGFLIRQNGLVSFGHALFYGGAAYLLALALEHRLVSVEVAVIAAVVVPTVFAFLIGFVMLRVAGVAFSMLTLAVAQAGFELVMRWRSLANGEDGIAVALPDAVFGIPVAVFQRADSMFLICWGILMLVLLGLWLLGRSHFGTLTLAIQGNEERARFIGYETMVPRAVVYAISAGIAALGGVLFAAYNGFVTPDSVHWTHSGEALVMAIIGGARTVWGPALGAMLYFFVRDAAGSITDHWPAFIGIALIVVTVALPSGIGGALGTLARRIFGGRHG